MRPKQNRHMSSLVNARKHTLALNRPPCDSTNTKFCHFKNYSLSQPRHFCKTCRLNWTRGGALRNVPVGGGCRRNKRSKSSSRSQSPTSTERAQTNSNNNNPSSTSSINPTQVGAAATNMLGLPPLRFMSPLAHHQLVDNFDGDHMGLSSYSGITAPTTEMSFHSGGGDMEQPAAGINYQFNIGSESSFMAGDGQTTSHHHHQTVKPKFSSSMASQLASKIMEERPELNLSRQLLGNNMPGNN